MKSIILALAIAAPVSQAEVIHLSADQHSQIVEADRLAKEANETAFRAVNYQRHGFNPEACANADKALLWASSASAWVGKAYILAASGQDMSKVIEHNRVSARIAVKLAAPCVDLSR